MGSLVLEHKWWFCKCAKVCGKKNILLLFCFVFHFSKHNRGLSPAWNHPFDEWEFWSSGKDWKSQWQHSEIEKNVEDLHETHRRFRWESQGSGFSQWNQLWTGNLKRFLKNMYLRGFSKFGITVACDLKFGIWGL